MHKRTVKGLQALYYHDLYNDRLELLESRVRCRPTARAQPPYTSRGCPAGRGTQAIALIRVRSFYATGLKEHIITTPNHVYNFFVTIG